MPLEDSELEVREFKTARGATPKFSVQTKAGDVFGTFDTPNSAENFKQHLNLWRDKHALRERIAELKSLRNQDRYTNRDSYADVRIHKLQGQLNALEGKDEYQP